MDPFSKDPELAPEGKIESEGGIPFHDDVDDLIKASTVGLRHHRDKRFDRSLEQFWNALILSRQMGYLEWESTALANIGMVYFSWGKYDHAFKFYSESLQIASAAGFRQGQATIYNNIGRIHDSRGQLERALESYRTALEISDEIRDLPNKRLSLMNMIRCYEKRGDFMLCAQLFEEVIRIDQIMGHPDLEADRAYLERLMARL
jgi:tetratricopeptide (TPR) repeat protein